MSNKSSRLAGYNQSPLQLSSGNSAQVIQMDTGDVDIVTFNGLGQGAGSNDPFLKIYPQPTKVAPAFATLPIAPPTGIGCVCEGWVNGAPMWVALTNSTTITSGALMTSRDGINWYARAMTITPGAGWKSIAFGNGVFVAVAGGTATATSVAYSNDGITWAFATMPSISGGAYNHVAFGGTLGNGIFVAVATANTTGTTIYTSRDGITWVAQTSTAGAGNYTSAAWGNPKSDGTGMWVFTLLGTTTNTTVYTSVPTGITLAAFVAVTLPTAPLTTGPVTVAYHPNAGLLAPASNNLPVGDPNQPQGDFVLGAAGSSAGTALTMSVSQTLILPGMLVTGPTVLPGTYIVSGSGTAYVLNKSQSIPSGTLNFYRVVQPFTPYTGMFVILCSTVSLAAGAMFRFDGTTAYTVPMPANVTPGATWIKMAYSQGFLFALNTSVATNNALMYSNDGINWTWVNLPSAPGGAWNNLAGGDFLSGLLVLVANVSAVGTALAQCIIGQTLLVEVSNSPSAEGFPDLFIAGNQAGFLPDVTRIY